MANKGSLTLSLLRPSGLQLGVAHVVGFGNCRWLWPASMGMISATCFTYACCFFCGWGPWRVRTAVLGGRAKCERIKAKGCEKFPSKAQCCQCCFRLEWRTKD